MDRFYEKIKEKVINPEAVDLLKNQGEHSYLNSDFLCSGRILVFYEFVCKNDLSLADDRNYYSFYIDLYNVLTEIRKFFLNKKQLIEKYDEKHDLEYRDKLLSIASKIEDFFQQFNVKDLIIIEHHRNCICHSVSQDMYRYEIRSKKKQFEVKTKVYSKILGESIHIDQCLSILKEHFESYNPSDESSKYRYMKILDLKNKMDGLGIIDAIKEYRGIINIKRLKYLFELSLQNCLDNQG